MRKLRALQVEFYIDLFGKLRIKNLDDYEVIGFKIKPHRGKRYVFPVFRMSIGKK
jgi:hypothetical protein